MENKNKEIGLQKLSRTQVMKLLVSEDREVQNIGIEVFKLLEMQEQQEIEETIVRARGLVMEYIHRDDLPF